MLLWLLIFIIILAVIYWCYDKVQLDPPYKNIGYIVILIGAVYVLLTHFGFAIP